jgi:hypothetical protein
MNIETGKTSEQDYIVFKNTYNEKITLVAQGEQLRCALREDGDRSVIAPYTRFTREEVRAALPYLQAYANNGTFELQEVGADIADQGKRIADLEELIKRWRTVSEVIHIDEDLQEKTAELLGEEGPSHE